MQATAATREEIDERHITEVDGMDGCIVERPKFLIWSKNTYKQKKKERKETRMGGGE